MDPVACIKSLHQIGFYCKVIDLCEKWPTTAIKSVISNSSFFLAGKPIINGCSVPLKLPFLFKKTFTPSCRKHDICYYRVSRVVTLQFQFPSLEPNASRISGTHSSQFMDASRCSRYDLMMVETFTQINVNDRATVINKSLGKKRLCVVRIESNIVHFYNDVNSFEMLL